MPTFGIDISGYQPRPEIMDGYSFVIINVQDPGLFDKVEYAVAHGIRWAIYSWVYPNDNGHAITRAQAAIELLELHGYRSDFPAIAWLDVEEAGVGSWDVDQNLALAQQRGIAAAVYTYLNVLPGFRQVIDKYQADLWLAYYPGNNDGSYWPEYSATAIKEGAKLHQYTSTAGTLDKNVVIDQAWYDANHKPDKPTPRSDMPIIYKLAGDDGWVFVVFYDHTSQPVKRLITSPDEFHAFQRQAYSGQALMQLVDGAYQPFHLEAGDDLHEFPDYVPPTAVPSAPAEIDYDKVKEAAESAVREVAADAATP